MSLGSSKALARPGAANAAPSRAMRRESTGPSLTMHTPVAEVRETAARCEASSGPSRTCNESKEEEASSGGAEYQRWGGGEIAGGVAERGCSRAKEGRLDPVNACRGQEGSFRILRRCAAARLLQALEKPCAFSHLVPR